MGPSLFWLQCGGCGGDTWSLFNEVAPSVADLFELLDIELLWHPSLSNDSLEEQKRVIEALINGSKRLDILCVEGSVLRGPQGTGLYDVFDGKPKKNLLAALAKRAGAIVAVGTCASFGGFGAGSETEATGVQFLKWQCGGFLGSDFVSREGLPVINLPGCPCHYDVVTGTLAALANRQPIELTDHNTPAEWFNIMIHQGCTRNEYHEYRVEDKRFGEKGCLFFHLGCHGPLAHGPCNKLLWHKRSSKTRVGVPCFGCTRPDFPQSYPFFQTRNIEGIPLELPEGISRAHYLAYKGMAAAAAPKRLKTRKTGI